MVNNPQVRQKVPEAGRGAPALWLVRNDASARRLRRDGGRLRTVVGLDTLISHRLDTIDLDQVSSVEVVAPYAPPAPKLALIVAGLAVGLALGSCFSPTAALAFAVVTITFALVAGIVGGATSAPQRLARLQMSDGRAHTVSYRVEDEDEVRGVFGEGKWRDDNMARADDPLTAEEEKQAERMRLGAALVASAAALAVLALAPTTTDEPMSAWVTIPVNVLYLGVLAFALLFSGVAWWRMSRVARR